MEKKDQARECDCCQCPKHDFHPEYEKGEHTEPFTVCDGSLCDKYVNAPVANS